MMTISLTVQVCVLTRRVGVSEERKPSPKFAKGAKVKVVAAKDGSSPESVRHQGKTGYVTSCKPGEHPVVFLYDVELEADKTTAHLLPETCLQKA